jgi:hypothetical protein
MIHLVKVTAKATLFHYILLKGLRPHYGMNGKCVVDVKPRVLVPLEIQEFVYFVSVFSTYILS